MWLFLLQAGCRPEPIAPHDTGSLSADDLDGDGWSPAGGDCDDEAPRIHPDAAEICGDGIDNNCNGQETVCLGTYAGDFAVTDATSIEDFCLFYDRVERDLTIQATELERLDGLECLTGIGGSLVVDSNADLVELGGLGRLESVGGDLVIQRNERLPTLDGLSSLGAVGQTLYVAFNDSLSTAVLGSLSGAVSDVSVESNPALVSFDLPMLETATWLTVGNDPALQSLGPFASLAHVDQLTVSDNAALPRIDGFDALTSVDLLSIQSNPALQAIDGFASILNMNMDGIHVRANDALETVHLLVVVAGDIVVADNPSLVTLALPRLSVCRSLLLDADASLSVVNFAKLSELDSLGIAEVGLVDLTGFPSLQEVSSEDPKQGFTIERNPALVSLDGLEALGNVTDLRVAANPVLAHIDLPENSSFKTVVVEDNPLLENISGSSARIDSSLVVEANPSLLRIDGFSGTVNAGGSLTIADNDALAELAAFPAMHKADALVIADNDALASLGVWPVLDLDELTIARNASLGSLAGLSTVRVTHDFVVTGNASLATLGPLAPGSDLLALTISANDMLPSLAGLGGIESVDTLAITDNHSLVSLAGVEGMLAAGEVVVASNPALTDVSALATFATDAYWSLTLEDNASLATLDGMSALTTISDLVVSANASLTSLAGLAGLAEVHRDLIVDANPALTAIGLDALVQIDRDLTVTDNTALSTVDVTAFQAGLEYLGGTALVSGNAP